MISPKLFGGIRLVTQSPLSSCGMPAIGILNPQEAIERKKCKLCANTMNKK